MKFTLSWLKDHLDTDKSAREIADRLTAIGLEIEELLDPADKLAPFKIAYVVEAVQHPNADKLRLCKVDAGDGIVQVVCGAPNARTGMKGVFAPSGTYVPGADLLLKPTKIRGVDSNGMLCSARELMLGDDHDGIIELPADAPVGRPALEVLKVDPVFHVAVTPNRPDALGVAGIARDLAAAGLGTLKTPAPAAVKGEFPCPIPIALEFPPGAEGACPMFAGRLIRGVKNGPSPKWLQDRLKAIGLRPISVLVDITNYITFDRGRPLHVYDAAKIRKRIIARLGRPGEKMLGLDGKTYELDGEMCAIADESGAIGLGGVMGGETTGVSEETRDVFIECAYFDPLRTAMTGRKLSLITDARFRFERGVDPAFVEPGLELATRMVLDLCGGMASAKLVAGKASTARREIAFDTGEITRLVGVRPDDQETVRILTALGFEPKGTAPRLTVHPPTWRPDVEGKADIVEEVVRIWGLDRVPPAPMKRPEASAGAVLTRAQRMTSRARRALAARGLAEAVTWSFIPHAHAEIFGGGDQSLVLDNPISSEMTTMRPSLLPGLLAAAARNAARGLSPVELFEVGHVFAGDAPEAEHLVAAIVRQGSRARDWRKGIAAADAFDAKADAAALLAELGAPRELMEVADAPSWYHPGRSGSLKLGPKLALAHFGEVHPRILKAFDLKGPVVAAEMFLETVPEARAKGKAKPKLDAPDLMPVARDFAFVVDAAVRAIDLVKAARGADKALIAEVSVFDVYEGKGIDAGKKSLAIEVRLQPREKTLTDEEIEAVSLRIIAAVTKATGGTLRA
ncbi:MAG: phenylalanine--tRNA ligase subunit beta [Alphaproteobacteria bacterium]